MEITGRTRVCGLLGDPVSESRSPFIQNMLAELCGYDLLYACFRVADHSPAAVEQVLRGAYNMNVLGLNATLPLKSLVIPYLAEVDPMAAKIGALNTLVRTVMLLVSEPAMQGRVLALHGLVFLGSTPIGGLAIGAVVEQWGVRVGLLVGGISVLVATFVAELMFRRADNH